MTGRLIFLTLFTLLLVNLSWQQFPKFDLGKITKNIEEELDKAATKADLNELEKFKDDLIKNLEQLGDQLPDPTDKTPTPEELERLGQEYLDKFGPQMLNKLRNFQKEVLDLGDSIADSVSGNTASTPTTTPGAGPSGWRNKHEGHGGLRGGKKHGKHGRNRFGEDHGRGEFRYAKFSHLFKEAAQGNTEQGPAQGEGRRHGGHHRGPPPPDMNEPPGMGGHSGKVPEGEVGTVASPTNPEICSMLRRSAGTVSEDDMSTFTKNNADFAFSLFKKLDGQKGNLFFSPFSISEALAMTYAGSAGETEQKMKEKLQFTLKSHTLHNAFNFVDQSLTSDRTAEGFKLTIANALWGKKGMTFKPRFIDILTGNYGTCVREVDFAGNPGEARDSINKWVKDQTNDKIKELIPSNGIDKTTALVLVNAIYFKGDWNSPFEHSMTKEDQFNHLDGTHSKAKMMHQLGYFEAYKNDKYLSVQMPYIGGDLRMTVVMPKNFDDFKKDLTSESFQTVLNNLDMQLVDLKLPKFTFDSKMSLKDSLKSLGLDNLFGSDADLSNVNGKKGDLYVSDVFHDAIIAVDEQGTEAAAATAVSAAGGGVPIEEDKITVTIDHPFVFAIHDKKGNIIFFGQFTTPDVE